MGQKENYDKELRQVYIATGILSAFTLWLLYMTGTFDELLVQLATYLPTKL